MVTGEKLREALLKYVPENAVDDCVDWISKYRIGVRIKHSRASKYGDYRPPQNGNGHMITINHDLNKYAFLITFTHEVAHLTCYLKHKNYAAPHGEEWKSEFRYLLKDFLDRSIFPNDIAAAVSNYLKNPAASSCVDTNLMKALKKYDATEDGWIHLEDVPYDAIFETKQGQSFKRGVKLRKNYECFDLSRNHKYFIHPLMEVKLLNC